MGLVFRGQAHKAKSNQSGKQKMMKEAAESWESKVTRTWKGYEAPAHQTIGSEGYQHNKPIC